MLSIFLAIFTVVICFLIGYNNINLKCSITLVSFEPTFTLNGIPILPSSCQAFTRKRIAEEDKRFGCGDPPSIARSQKARADILGIVL